MSALLNFFDTSIYPHLQTLPLPMRFSLAGSIFGMFCIVYLSKYVQAGLSLLLTQRYDNVQASHRYGKNKDGKRSWQEKTIERAFSAHNNHWEAFIAFSVAVLLALLRADSTDAATQQQLVVLANAFLYVRVLFNAVYVLAFNTPLSLVRSAVWMVGSLIIVKIFLLSIDNILL